MTEVRTATASSWHDELASLLDDSVAHDPLEVRKPGYVSPGDDSVESESVKEQAKEFVKAWAEMMLDLAKGFKDIAEQSLMTDDSFVVQKLGKPCAKVTGKLSFLNEYLPEDRDPVHAWPVILFVVIVALAALGLNSGDDRTAALVKKVQVHPPSAARIQLPDGRHIAYDQLGIPADRARHTIIIPHPLLFSRLTGIPRVEAAVLEEYGVRLVTYDLPGFGESDPHPGRDLNSSAFDMLHLADAVGVGDKFWLLGYSSASMHVWAALKYIPHRVAGAAFIAPMINPYEPSMNKEERYGTWANWSRRRKLIYFLARRFPNFLSILYRRKFLSGEHGHVDDWLSFSMGQKDEALTNEEVFEEFWYRNVEESIRQGDIAPFVEESVLQVSNWGFKLADLQVQRKCHTKGLVPWLKSIYSQAECELTGFLGPIHVWQGMDDELVPPSMTDYITRVLRQATVHRLSNEGHFSYFFFCAECHRQILSTLFGAPQGPLEIQVVEDPIKPIDTMPE
ncbi:uncharacterized protein LOC116208056 isoform X2 [Punica granatum]|nr:uncharacterized protein LOC116208056 isoform X2 [Punica granatum]XP_031397124.1 uncharacterized protein LOC116208056 isoform X2 [Punica granatum]XP_031397125.1 uncharacterized protein LOC116208056 isoform X2 [Punica granatum]XP_031397126.1 uncharacterized protein LOC116208056 isoform X2 [Punica granatum]OWM82380.1 hypothetical protein CDL15_Pgr001954 [Punica granatum]